MNTTMTYNQLYSNMVKMFTVEKNNTEYKLGDYMLMKADAKKTNYEAQNLPVAANHHNANAIVSVFSYVNDKLKVKEPPVRDKTIRTFPFRTSLTAFCSAVVMCALVVSCGVIGLKNQDESENIVEAEYSEQENEQSEEKISETAEIFG